MIVSEWMPKFWFADSVSPEERETTVVHYCCDLIEITSCTHCKKWWRGYTLGCSCGASPINGDTGINYGMAMNDGTLIDAENVSLITRGPLKRTDGSTMH